MLLQRQIFLVFCYLFIYSVIYLGISTCFYFIELFFFFGKKNKNKNSLTSWYKGCRVVLYIFYLHHRLGKYIRKKIYIFVYFLFFILHENPVEITINDVCELFIFVMCVMLHFFVLGYKGLSEIVIKLYLQ